MDTNKAVGILIGAVELGNKRGAFELKESKIIAEAVEFLMPTPPPVAQKIEPTPENDGTGEVITEKIK